MPTVKKLQRASLRPTEPLNGTSVSECSIYSETNLNLLLCFSSCRSQVLKSRLQHPRCEQRVPVLEMPPSPNYLARLPAIPPQHPLASNHPLARWALPFLTLRGHQVQSLPPHQPHPHHHPHPHPPPPPPHAQFPAHPHPAQPAIFPHPGLYPHHAMLPTRFVLPVIEREHNAKVSPDKGSPAKVTPMTLKSRLISYSVPTAIPSWIILLQWRIQGGGDAGGGQQCLKIRLR